MTKETFEILFYTKYEHVTVSIFSIFQVVPYLFIFIIITYFFYLIVEGKTNKNMTKIWTENFILFSDDHSNNIEKKICICPDIYFKLLWNSGRNTDY